MTDKLIRAELMRNAEALVSAIDVSQPVGLDVGALIPALRLLEDGLPGCERWSFGVSSVGPQIILSKRIEGKGWLDARIALTWEQMRLFVSGPDVFLRHCIADALKGLEQKENELCEQPSSPA